MNTAKLYSVSVVVLVSLGIACAQQTDPNAGKPSVFLENNRYKPPKPSNARIIQGMVKDQADNPVAGAIVQLKNVKSSKVVDFATKDDGKYAFRDLFLDNDYELLAKRGDLTTPVKKVSIYDTRKEVTINFKLEPAFSH
jgi:Carboxypeptidase regulatory-like domain